MSKVVAFAVVSVALVAAAAWLWREEVAPNHGVQAPAAGAPAPNAASAPAVTTAPAAGVAPRSTSMPARAPARVRPPTLYGELTKARSYRALYDRLHDSAEGLTAEGRLVLYEILRECATVTGGRWRNRAAIPKREDFLARLAPNDPTRERRIAAYDEFTVNRCAGLETISITQADLTKMLQESAAGGDPRARAMSIEQELWQARRASGDRSATLSDAQIDGLKQAVATRDPDAIRAAGRVLSTTWSDYALRAGPDQLPVEPRPFMNAFLVLACEYGAPCGADTPRMQQACALQGHCDASTYPDYLMQYASTPHDSMLVTQYRGLLRYAIETGDWSQLNVVRGLPQAGSRAWFVPGPR